MIELQQKHVRTQWTHPSSVVLLCTFLCGYAWLKEQLPVEGLLTFVRFQWFQNPKQLNSFYSPRLRQRHRLCPPCCSTQICICQLRETGLIECNMLFKNLFFFNWLQGFSGKGEEDVYLRRDGDENNQNHMGTWASESCAVISNSLRETHVSAALRQRFTSALSLCHDVHPPSFLWEQPTMIHQIRSSAADRRQHLVDVTTISSGVYRRRREGWRHGQVTAKINTDRCESLTSVCRCLALGPSPAFC